MEKVEVEQGIHKKQLLNLEEVKALTGFSTTTIYKYMKLGKFPQSKAFSSRAVRWRLADIENFINS